MTYLRFAIYGGGGLILTVAYVLLALRDPESAANPWALTTAFVVGAMILYAVDRWIHGALYGERLVVMLDKYVPCPICPFTGGKASIRKIFVYHFECFGPVHAIIEHQLPILVSEEADARFPAEILSKVPGFHVVRDSSKKAVIYIKQKQYYDAFVAANERALV